MNSPTHPAIRRRTTARAATIAALGASLLALPAWADENCAYRGSTYSHGSAICQSGSQYRCNNSQWKVLGIVCAVDSPTAMAGCSYDGVEFSPGASTCQSGSQYRCDGGAWWSLAVGCNSAVQALPRPASSALTCLYNGATLADQSSICNAGVTFRCGDGEWHNLGTPCR